MRICLFAYLLICLFVLSGCRHDDIVAYDPDAVTYSGLYVLCEGNMGSNKASVDFLSFERDTLLNDVYPAVNPRVVLQLGDVGNDIATYMGRVYIVVNCSGKVEVTDRNLRRIGQVNIPNCRNICFSSRYAYVSSYAGPVGANNTQRGYVARIDIPSLRVVDTCFVGYQPNGVAILGDYLYVANSGGYMAPRYDSTISVIDLSSFCEVGRIAVAPNLDRLYADPSHGALFVTSLGNYSSIPPALYRIDVASGRVERMPAAATGACLVGDSLYYYRYAYGLVPTGFGVLNTATLRDNPLPLEQAASISVPYGIFVHPVSREIYVASSPSYVNPGYLYCYRPDFSLRRVFRTGDIPGHFALKQADEADSIP